MTIFSGKKLMTTLTFLGLYLFVTGISWAVFSYLKEEPGAGSQNTTENRKKIGEGLPKTEECPLNGMMYSKPEREIWETRRPLVTMIENSTDARPQSGLGNADVVYEALAEGGVTRFASVFYCGASAQELKLAPVRSARVYFIDWAAEYGAGKPIYYHHGGANNICNQCPGGVKPYGDIVSEADAFRKLEKIGWRFAKGNDFDGGTNIGYPIQIRDVYRLSKTEAAAWEHAVVSFSDKVFEEAEKRGFANKTEDGKPWTTAFRSWKFTDDNPASSSTASDIKFDFLGILSGYDVEWKYTKDTNSYLRFNGGKAHNDHNTGEQISSKNVVILFMEFKPSVDKEKHVLYTTLGSGKALVFQNGIVVEGTWQKKTMYDRTLLFDKDGKEITFVRGPIWIEAVPKVNVVNY